MLKIGIFLSKILSKLSILLKKGRGQVIGGKILLLICPNAIKLLTKNKKVILISSTNGKSTTTKFVNLLYKNNNFKTVTNETGANMPSGIAFSLGSCNEFDYAILEVDEPFLPRIIKETNPEKIIISNLSRDQLDRGSEVKMLAEKWKKAFLELPHSTEIIANANDPFIVYSSGDRKNNTYLGLLQNWTDDSIICPNCKNYLIKTKNKWKCSKCSLKMPTVASYVNVHDNFVIKGKKYNIKLQLPGLFNIGNALSAIYAFNPGNNIKKSIKILSNVKDVDGRYIQVNYHNKNIRLLLGKNPASWLEMINCIEAKNLIIALNSYAADGKDPSWIYDVPFEELKNKNVKVYVTGNRMYDMAVRLQIAGINILGTNADFMKIVSNFSGKDIDIIANYTAFQDLRRKLIG